MILLVSFLASSHSGVPPPRRRGSIVAVPVVAPGERKYFVTEFWFATVVYITELCTHSDVT